MKTLLLIVAALPLLAQQPVQTYIPITPTQASILKTDHEAMTTWAKKREADKQVIIAALPSTSLPTPLVCPNGVRQTQTIGIDPNKNPIELVIVQRCPTQGRTVQPKK